MLRVKTAKIVEKKPFAINELSLLYKTLNKYALTLAPLLRYYGIFKLSVILQIC